MELFFRFALVGFQKLTKADDARDFVQNIMGEDAGDVFAWMARIHSFTMNSLPPLP